MLSKYFYSTNTNKIQRQICINDNSANKSSGNSENRSLTPLPAASPQPSLGTPHDVES